MIRAVCIGEAMIELRSLGPATLARSVAGDAYNTAVYLKRSLEGAGEVAFLTAVGDDSLGKSLMADFHAHDIDTRLVFAEPGRPPGLYLIELDERGERSFHYWRGDSAARLWMARLEAAGGAEALAGADLVFLSGVSLAILPPEDRRKALETMAALDGRVGLIAFDPNVRPRLWADATRAREDLKAACGLADIVLASQVDGEWIWGEPDPRAQIDLCRALGAPEVVVTLGEDGALLWADGEYRLAPCVAATVTDTSGAGDSFNGAYLAARLRGVSPLAAAIDGQGLAARVVAAPGALIPSELSHPSEAHPTSEPA